MTECRHCSGRLHHQQKQQLYSSPTNRGVPFNHNLPQDWSPESSRTRDASTPNLKAYITQLQICRHFCSPERAYIEKANLPALALLLYLC